MRFNQEFIKFLAKKPADKEGGLYYKSPKDDYRLRWLKLRGNLLFVFKVPEKTTFGDKELVNVAVLEGVTIQEEPPLDQPFLFSLKFNGEGDKKHFFSCQTQQQCTEWVSAISSNNYSSLKEHFEFLRSQIKFKTGQDPVDIRKRTKNLPRRPSSEQVSVEMRSKFHPGTSTLVTPKNKAAVSNYRVGTSAFYQTSTPELKASFQDWETFD